LYAEHNATEHGLAGSGFAHQSDHPTWSQAHADAAQHRLIVDVKMQINDVEQSVRCGHGAHT